MGKRAPGFKANLITRIQLGMLDAGLAYADVVKQAKVLHRQTISELREVAKTYPQKKPVGKAAV